MLWGRSSMTFGLCFSCNTPANKGMAALRDLVEVLHTLKQVVCVKG